MTALCLTRPVSICWMHYNLDLLNVKLRKKSNIRNRYNQAPQLTKDTTCDSDENTIKHNIQESQEVSPFPAGDHKTAMNRQENKTNTKHKKQK